MLFTSLSLDLGNDHQFLLLFFRNSTLAFRQVEEVALNISHRSLSATESLSSFSAAH